MARSKVKVTFDKRAFERGLKKLAGEASEGYPNRWAGAAPAHTRRMLGV